MNAAYVVMYACYAVMIPLLVTGLVRVRGDHWQTSWRWMVAGWAAYAVGFVFFVIGLAS